MSTTRRNSLTSITTDCGPRRRPGEIEVGILTAGGGAALSSHQRDSNPCLNRDHAFANELNGIRHERSEKANGTKTSSPPESLVQFLLSSWASPTSFRRSAYQRSRPPRAGWRFERGARKLSGGVFMAPEQRMPQRRPRRRTSTGLARRLRSRGRRRPPATASAPLLEWPAGARATCLREACGGVDIKPLLSRFPKGG